MLNQEFPDFSRGECQFLYYMVSKIKKGNYYRLRTKKWFEDHGYCVEVLERRKGVFIKDKKTGQGKIIFTATDIFGSDLLAMKETEIIFIQVKTHQGDVLKGLNEFLKYPFPSFVKRQVVRWELRAREPEIKEL